MTAKPELSVVIPVTERYDDVKELYESYRDAVAKVTDRFEFIYVLGGRYDEIQEELERLANAGQPVRALRITSAPGEATAIMAGFDHALADKILLLPAYYQVKPPSIFEFIQSFGDEDVLVARRWPRKDSMLNRLMTRAFSWLLGFITSQGFHDVGCGVRLFRREVLEEISLYGDQHRFLPILAVQRGFVVKEYALPQDEKDARLRVYRPGVYVRRLLDLLAMFFVVKFTKKPLRFFGLVGSSLMMVGGAILIMLVAQRLLTDVSLAQRPLLLFGVLMVGLGIQLLALGLIGELIIFTHAKELKEYAIAETVNIGPEDSPRATSPERESASNASRRPLSNA